MPQFPDVIGRRRLGLIVIGVFLLLYFSMTIVPARWVAFPVRAKYS